MWRKKQRHIRGDQAEQLAQRWLQQQGLSLIKKNYRCKAGEIDLVMRDRNTLVFVEVRFRRQSRFGSSIESVDWRKQKKLIIAARHFLATQGEFCHLPCRFDVVAATFANECTAELSWQWIQQAFDDHG